MLEKGDAKKGEKGWLFYAAGSAVFAALQSILGKVGVQDMDSTLATALRTVVVLVFAWAIVLGKKEGGDWKKMTRRDAVLLVLSGITTGASWLCYYRRCKPAAPAWWCPSTSAPCSLPWRCPPSS